jgi:site-specific recombinase XerD
MVHPHMLRHSCGYRLANNRTDPRVMQDLLGHRDPKHTAHYTRIAAARRADVGLAETQKAPRRSLRARRLLALPAM